MAMACKSPPLSYGRHEARRVPALRPTPTTLYPTQNGMQANAYPTPLSSPVSPDLSSLPFHHDTFYHQAKRRCIRTSKMEHNELPASHIDSEIAQVQESIVALVKHHAMLKERRNSYAPVMVLPTEVLALIFEFACMGSDNVDDTPMDKSGEGPEREPKQQEDVVERGARSRIILEQGAVSPLFLGTICRAWRGIAWNAAHLWSTIKMRLDEQRSLAQAGLVRDWLARSRQRPLDITLLEDFPPTDDTDNDDDIETSSWLDTTSTAVIQVLAEHSHRWAQLDIIVPHAWKATLSQVRHRMPSLTFLRLRVSENCPSMSHISTFAHAPKLKHAALVGYAAADVDLPWSQLESLEGEYYTAGECLDTLRQCTSLRSAQFEQMYRGVMDPFATLGGTMAPIVDHKLLESFELILDSNIELRGVFQLLSLPALRTLIVSVPSQQPTLDLIMPMLTRSGCTGTLEKLHLVSTMPEEASLIESLRQLRGLNTLLLLDPAIGEERLGGITDLTLDLMHPWKCRKRKTVATREDNEQQDGSPAGCLLPNLRHFEYTGAATFHGRSFVDLLSGRWGPISTRAPMNRRSLANAALLISKPYPASPLDKVVFTTSQRIRFKPEESDLLSLLKMDGLDLQLCVESSDPESCMFALGEMGQFS